MDKRGRARWVARVGIDEVARRAGGVSFATVKRWIERGATGEASRAVEASLERSQRSVKSWATAQRKAADKPSAERPTRKRRPARPPLRVAGFTLPEDASDHRHSPDGLTDEQLTPTRLPTTERQDLRDRIRRTPFGRSEYFESSSLHSKRESFLVNENYIDVRNRGGIDAIADHARQRFAVAQRDGYDILFFSATLIRFIPENPNYTGALARKQGKWAPDSMTFAGPNVSAHADPEEVTRSVRHAFEFARTKGGQIGYAGSVDSLSNARSFWFFSYTFEFFKRKPPPTAPRVPDRDFGDEPLSEQEPERFRRSAPRPRKRRG